jgi:hypothetical protein
LRGFFSNPVFSSISAFRKCRLRFNPVFYLGLKGRSWPLGETRLPVEEEEEAELMAKWAELMQEDVEIIEVAAMTKGLEGVGEEAVRSETVDAYSKPEEWEQRYSLTFE